MQQDSPILNLWFFEDQSPIMFDKPPKRTYKYFTRHGVLKDFTHWKKQTIKRIDRNVVKYEGSLDKWGPNETTPDSTFERLIHLILSSKKVSRLQLRIFSPCCQIRNQELFMLRKAFKKHHSLQSFSFYFFTRNDKFNLTYDKIQKFCQSLKILSSLQKIHIQLDSDHELEMGNVLMKFVQGLKTQRSLQNIYLNLAHFICPQELLKLGQYLRRLPFIKNTHLSFTPSGIACQGLKALVQGMKGLDYLHDISWRNSTDPELEIRILNEPKPHSQRHHNMMLVIKKMRPEVLFPPEQVFYYLEGFEPSQNKSLHLTSCLNFTAQGLRALNKALEKPQSFQRLVVEFKQCNQIDEKEFRRFCESLKELSCLTTFELLFDMSQVTNGTISQLSQGLKEMKSLAHIELAVMSCLKTCDKMDDKGVGLLGESLRGIPSLQTAHLCFSYCNNVSQEGIDRLRESLKHLQSQVDYCPPFKRTEEDFSEELIQPKLFHLLEN